MPLVQGVGAPNMMTPNMMTPVAPKIITPGASEIRMPSFVVSVQVGAGVGASPTRIPANANVLLSVNTIANVIAVIVFFIFFLLKVFLIFETQWPR